MEIISGFKIPRRQLRKEVLQTGSPELTESKELIGKAHW